MGGSHQLLDTFNCWTLAQNDVCVAHIVSVVLGGSESALLAEVSSNWMRPVYYGDFTLHVQRGIVLLNKIRFGNVDNFIRIVQVSLNLVLQ